MTLLMNLPVIWKEKTASEELSDLNIDVGSEGGELTLF